MLTLLRIDNIAVIEEAEIEFGRGLNILTGETGAGKSIVIDAIEAVLGWRTSREIVRKGAETAAVTAVFTSDGADMWCEANDIEHDGELVLQRKLTADGRSSCRINGIPISASQLRELGLLLMDIHGQGDGQRLTNEKYHRAYLDSFGGLTPELKEYQDSYAIYKGISDEIEALKMDEGEKERKMDMLKFQIGEIERADITVGEYEEKVKRRDLLKSAGKLTEALAGAFAALYGGDRADGALSMIGMAENSIVHCLRFSEELTGVAEKLKDLRFQAEDAAEELRAFQDKLDFSPNELDELESRLNTISRITRKYGGTEETVLAFLEKCKDELDNIEYSDEKLKKLEAQLEKSRQSAFALAKKLSEKRKAAGEELSKRIEKELLDLSMGSARFFVSVKSSDDLGSYGMDDVSFVMAANAGESVGKISKIASGGELSRIMLAMKNVLSEGDSVNAMVFDEIDTGVSGIAAQRVAEKLASISAGKQVICVTHLPQIAAMADEHFCIEKQEKNGRTYTNVMRLDYDGRKNEIARLTGGENITDTTLMSAAEQLEAAERYKKEMADGL